MTTGHRRRRADRLRGLAWPVAGATIALIAIGTLGMWTSGQNDAGDLPLAVLSVVGAAFFASLGALIASRTGNRIGWLYLGIIAVEGVGFAASAYGDRDLPGATVVRSFADPFFLGGLTLFVAILLLFPTGRLASPRWRWVWWPYVAAVALTFVGFLVNPTAPAADLAGGTGSGSAPDANALGVEALGGVLDPVLAIAGFTVLLAAVAGLVCLVVRFRGGSSEERQQIRWLVTIAALAGVALLATIGTGITVEAAENAGEDPSQALVLANNLAMLCLVAFVVVGIPLATTIAILRYRLYDLNLVVRRTVTVALIAAAITAVYVAIVVAVPAFIGRDGTGGGVDPLALLAAAVVAAAFDPLRRAARRLADRLVYGQRATPYEVLTAFGDRVGETYSLDDVLPRMAEVLARGTGASSASAWLSVGSEMRRAATWPPDDQHDRGSRIVPTDGTVERAIPDEHRVEVRHHGELLGALSVRMPPSEPLDPAKEALVRDLAAHAGLLLRNVRLIEELRASRQRLVAAQDEERRKLERNIHDGVQQQLVALNVQLGLLARTAERDPSSAARTASELQSLAMSTLEDLRDLARGIYPPLLADQGLEAALGAQARKAVVPTVIDAEGLGRYPHDVEAAVYFSVLEAMNNVAKYAEASDTRVELAQRNGSLEFAVSDDGRGFDPLLVSRGTGLQGIVDRLDAIGGEVTVESGPGAGTTVRGSVPVEAAP